MENDKKPKVTLYCEYYHLWNGFFFKKAGMGFVSSYKNQMLALSRTGVSWTEDFSAPCDIFQANTQGLRTWYLLRKFRQRGAKTIVYAHASAEELSGGFRLGALFVPLYRFYLSKLYDYADIVIAVSDYSRGALATKYRLAPEKVIVVSNGVDALKFSRDETKRQNERHRLGIGADDFLVIDTAMALYKKGIKTFIAVAEKFPKIKFVWFGKIFKSLFAEKIPKHGPNVTFAGFVPDIVAAFSAADIFFFPSYEENQGMVVLEAGAAALPVIVRDISVYHGWLCDNENCLKATSDDEFAEKILLLAGDAELRRRLGLALQKTVFADHSLEAVGEKLKKIYSKLLS